MNEQQVFERIVAESVAGVGPLKPRDGAVLKTISSASGKRQRPQWLALIKEPPMRTNSRVTAGSPAVRVAAILAATFLLAVALAAVGVAGQRLLAADSPIVVAQDGSGTYTTITEAVEAAADGDTIEIRPGTYVENVLIVGKDLEVVGDGDLDAIVIEAAADGPPSAFDWASYMEVDDPPDPHAMILADTSSTVTNLTFVGDSVAVAVVGSDADVAFSGIKTLGLVVPPRGAVNALAWEAGARGSLSDSHVEGWVTVNEGATVVVEGNEMPATCMLAWGPGADVTIRDNTIHGCEFEKGLEIDGSNTALIEGNTIWVEEADPGPPNELWGGREAIEVTGAGGGIVTIRDNDLRDSRVGIYVTMEDATVEASGNRITDNETGLKVGFGAEVQFTGNTLCGNDQDYELPIGLDEAEIASANEACEADTTS